MEAEQGTFSLQVVYTVKPRLSAPALQGNLGRRHEIMILNWLNFGYFSLLENSAYKITPLEGKNIDGPLKNVQPGFNCI